MTCEARQYSDQMVCHACGLAWDMNDLDPPPCNKEKNMASINSPLNPFRRDEFDPNTGDPIPGADDARPLSQAEHLKSLGNTGTQYAYDRVTPEVLETFPNPMPPGAGRLTIRQPEFTSLCPKTGQPDFATIVIRYSPREKCVESKSLKLYLGSFRNVGEFHEACVARIAKDLFDLMEPNYLFVEGQFTPRGGIPFWPTVDLYHDDYLGSPIAPNEPTPDEVMEELQNEALNPNQ